MTNVYSRETFTDYEINEMIREADADGDGKVSYNGKNFNQFVQGITLFIGLFGNPILEFQNYIDSNSN